MSETKVVKRYFEVRLVGENDQENGKAPALLEGAQIPLSKPLSEYSNNEQHNIGINLIGLALHWGLLYDPQFLLKNEDAVRLTETVVYASEDGTPGSYTEYYTSKQAKSFFGPYSVRVFFNELNNVIHMAE